MIPIIQRRKNQTQTSTFNQTEAMVTFKEADHSYHSVDPNEKIDWISVTTLVSQFKKPFDAAAQAAKSSRNSKSKWFKMNPKDIQAAWRAESKRADGLGHWYHSQREGDLLALDTITRDGIAVPVFKPIITDDTKHAPDQRLVQGIYPEHFVFLKSAGICGQSDRVEVVKDTVSVYDYKTNKEIKQQGFKHWDGTIERMLQPLSHLDDCTLVHYTLQLSLYMYIILKHNPFLKPGKLELSHVIFEQEGENEFGYPIHKVVNGEPVVKEVKIYKVPYMKSEVVAILKWLEENRGKLKSKH